MLKNKMLIKILLFLTISLFSFPVRAALGADSGATSNPSLVNSCLSAKTCIQVCEWDNSVNNNHGHVYVNYYFDGTWELNWIYAAKKKTLTSTDGKLPSDNNFTSMQYGLVNQITANGNCFPAAYVDTAAFTSGNFEVCFDDGKKNTDGKTYCVNSSNWGTTFGGTSSLVSSGVLNENMKNFFHSTAIPTVKNLSCDVFADDSGYKVVVGDEKDAVMAKISSLTKQDVKNVLFYGNEIPAFAQHKLSPFGIIMTGSYSVALTERYNECSEKFRTQAKTDFEAGILTSDEFRELYPDDAPITTTVEETRETIKVSVKLDSNSTPDKDYSEEGCAILGPDVIKFLKQVLTVIQIAGPILAIVLSMGDFLGAVMAGDTADSIKKSSKKFMTRLIVAGILIILPVIIKFLLDVVLGSSNSTCI